MYNINKKIIKIFILMCYINFNYFNLYLHIYRVKHNLLNNIQYFKIL